uniref:Uncharacterized protein n=1 Tax=Arundo donax TaxID=35708 RepID=A0A0A9E874_ARUDO
MCTEEAQGDDGGRSNTMHLLYRQGEYWPLSGPYGRSWGLSLC